jgi:DNA-binding CsgD family transcriptional regulator
MPQRQDLAMSTAFSVAYPADRSLLARVLLPFVQPRAYLRAIRFALMFPMGIGYFIFFATAFAIGGGLIWTILGPPVILFALLVSLFIGDVEAWLVNITTREGIRRPPKIVEGANTLREKVWTRLIDPSTWTGVIYEVAQFPVGLAAFMVVLIGGAFSATLIAGPFILMADANSEIVRNELANVSFGLFDAVIDKPLEAAPLVPVGLVLWLVTLHLVTVLSAVHAAWARLMLGTRARHARRYVAPEPSGDEPEPGTPIALLPPVEPLPPTSNGREEPVAVDGDRAPPVDAAPDLDVHPALRELTAREREVLLLVARGYSNADICEACYISEGTVKTHIRHILAKLELTDRTQVVVFAYEQGVILPARRPVAMAIAR